MAAKPDTAKLTETLSDLEDYLPTVPDEVTAHILKVHGAQLQDPRLVRLVSLAAQNFLAGVINDTLQVQKRRKQASAWRQKELGYNAKDQRLVLTTEDVAEALKELGVNVTAPQYFANGQKQ
jgi:transcription initiation factor TFIID subunit 10